jgi:hypothetical protein
MTASVIAGHDVNVDPGDAVGWLDEPESERPAAAHSANGIRASVLRMLMLGTLSPVLQPAVIIVSKIR